MRNIGFAHHDSRITIHEIMNYFFQMPGMIWLVLALPLFGATLNGALALYQAKTGRAVSRTFSGLLAFGVMVVAFGVALRYFYVLSSFGAGSFAPIIEPLFTWVAFGSWVLEIGVNTDQLSMIMTLIITGVGSLIHLYSIGYMSHDKGFVRYFAYLNLFVFFMLCLVLADNLFLMFIGWEGVGLCSYLLIGFWFGDTEKAAAGKKAFIVNRIGDFGFLLGMFMIWVALHDFAAEPGQALLNFAVIKDYALMADGPLLPLATVICLLLFVGACGKSAQIPLYVWLPDAMAGPTPVSALIHAATMVTAGVYMIVRLNFLYVLSPTAMSVIATVGAVTALFAATIALVQDDIKKVLAYSTVSQLGYMFLAVGVGAFSAGVFHLMTHAFFKALLFLGSGAVIHAMDNEQRMSRYGGLRKELPITFWTFLVGTLAIAGMYPFAGFFSKDAVLWNVLHPVVHVPGNTILWAMGVLTACLTAFYMFRLLGMTFFGDRTAAGKHIHCHKEDSVSMLVPLVILAVLSFVGGWVGVPAGFGGEDHFYHFLAPLIVQHGQPHDHTMEMIVGLATMLAVSVSGLIAWTMYAQRSPWPAKMAAKSQRMYRTLLNKYYIDEMYQAVIVKPLIWISRNILWKFQDAFIIDRSVVHGSARFAVRLGKIGTALHTGAISNYVLGIVVGSVVIIGYLCL